MAASSKSSQEFVPVKEVRDGVLVLQDNSLRAVLMVSSINFALQSEESQTAIVAQFQNFLNSLDFSVEISMQSRKMDIKPYLSLLEERYQKQQSELMKIQTREYIEFIKTFTDNTNIMTKTFFITVPYGATMVSLKKNPLETISGFVRKSDTSKKTKGEVDEFEEHKEQLQQRLAVVEQGLVRCGLKTARLGSEELIELFYRLFNPGEAQQRIPTS
ncbi:MAG: hypothetical protein A2664_01240 [Candidatus Taylorbacteria bacterium RIFCSPHIGHO2_01_FULL_46_22b]|uniref:TraC-like domain-containing protein n=1 Tax=Candidatus Taylorbacteria bacterium RIFCSPHIGHO2_01_FULL_46_22b TaxID=1802301 RepID=A0A1G2M241_9BACT|nr:MAG: hypothetical protein A2664_01240 [Candidatus Taylorbacteria bacterium RIFCSPHIGHO2_01_FULL_46_22b]